MVADDNIAVNLSPELTTVFQRTVITMTFYNFPMHQHMGHSGSRKK